MSSSTASRNWARGARLSIGSSWFSKYSRNCRGLDPAAGRHTVRRSETAPSWRRDHGRPATPAGPPCSACAAQRSGDRRPTTAPTARSPRWLRGSAAASRPAEHPSDPPCGTAFPPQRAQERGVAQRLHKQGVAGPAPAAQQLSRRRAWRRRRRSHRRCAPDPGGQQGNGGSAAVSKSGSSARPRHPATAGRPLPSRTGVSATGTLPQCPGRQDSVRRSDSGPPVRTMTAISPSP